MPRAGARPSARSKRGPVRMAPRWDSTTRSAAHSSCGRCIESGRRSDRGRSRAARACRATDRSTGRKVVQDPGGRRERPSGSREPPDRSGRTTPHLRHVPGGAFHVSPSECDASVSRARRRARRREGKRCLTTDGPGRTAVRNSCNTVERRRPAWHGAMGRGLTRLPLLGAPAAPSRRRRITDSSELVSW